MSNSKRKYCLRAQKTPLTAERCNGMSDKLSRCVTTGDNCTDCIKVHHLNQRGSSCYPLSIIQPPQSSEVDESYIG